LEKLSKLKINGTLKIEDDTAFENTLLEVRYKKWNVYAKAPFGGPEQVLEYLGRYTHKVAISTHRIKEITNESITFSYKDYKDKNKQKFIFAKTNCTFYQSKSYKKNATLIERCIHINYSITW
jgi:hypothetical protein